MKVICLEMPCNTVFATRVTWMYRALFSAVVLITCLWKENG